MPAPASDFSGASAQGLSAPVRWLCDHVIFSFGCGEEAIKRLLSSDSRTSINAFVDTPEFTRLFVVSQENELVAAPQLPAKARKKALFFIKTSRTALDKSDFSDLVVWGELGNSPLDCLSVLSSEVAAPLLRSQIRHGSMPDAAALDLSDSMQEFVSSLLVEAGRAKGQRVFPLPMGWQQGKAMGRDEPSTPRSQANDDVADLEASVVTWRHLLKGVLGATPQAAVQELGEKATPLSEVDFWESRAADLTGVAAQLTGPVIISVCTTLKAAGSTYASALDRLASETEAAREEAVENARFLVPLRKYLEAFMEPSDYQSLPETFKALMHALLLIWTKSKHYNTSSRLLPLLQLIMDHLVAQTRSFVPGPELLQSDPTEAADKLETALWVTKSFKSAYEACRIRSIQQSDRPWRFKSGAVFERLDGFRARLHALQDMFQSAAAFGRLERIEIGGYKGKAMTGTLRAMHAESVAAFAKMQALAYNPLDLSQQAFIVDYAAYQIAMNSIERRLAGILKTAFDESSSFLGAIKTLESFEGLLDRPALAVVVRKCGAMLMSDLTLDLRRVAQIFRSEKANPPLPSNAAPYSGAVTWLRSLRSRIMEPMDKVRGLGEAALSSEDGRAALSLHERLSADLAAYEAATVKGWHGVMADTSDQKLKLPLLRSDKQSETSEGLPKLQVNFDPALAVMLREVRYFLGMRNPSIDIPAVGLRLHERSEALRTQIGTLEGLCAGYNGVQRTMLPIEQPLLQSTLSAVDAELQSGLLMLTWNSHHIDEHIKDASAAVKELQELLALVQGTTKQAADLAADWAAHSLIEIKEGQVYPFADFKAQCKASFTARRKAIAAGGGHLGQKLGACLKALQLGRASPAWLAYVQHVAALVMKGLSDTALTTLSYINSLMGNGEEPTAVPAPLEIELLLQEGNLNWSPSLGTEAAGVGNTLLESLEYISKIGGAVERLDSEEGTFGSAILEDPQVLSALGRTTQAVLSLPQSAEHVRSQFMRFSYLWTRRIAEALQDFMDCEGVQAEDGTRDMPSLDKFEAEIAQFHAVEADVQAMPSIITEGLLHINTQPLKQALVVLVSKWIYLYTQSLQQRVLDSTGELMAFMLTATAALDMDVEPDSADSQAKVPKKEDAPLYRVMACLLDVKKRSGKTEASFGPLHDTVALLQRYNISLSESSLKQLEEAPVAWAALQKKITVRREALAHLQQAESLQIRRDSDAFQARVDAFRAFFQKAAPFAAPGGSLSLDQVPECHARISALESAGIEGQPSVWTLLDEAASLQHQQELFEMHVSQYLPLTRCQEELALMRAVWDMVAKVLGRFNEWYGTPWASVNVEALLEESRVLSKDVKGLSKAVRLYDVYQRLEEAVKAMVTSLPLVSELRHPAMRHRHWRQLMKATGVHFTMGNDFSLGDLMKLGLHQYVDACSEIVDQAGKELTIENGLKKIEETWASLNLTFGPYQESGVMQLVVEENVTETLESDNLILQNLSASKHVQGNEIFLTKVTAWQRQLGLVDASLSTWQDVQKLWQALESIYVGSEDIQKQLPQDSQRFNAINGQFKELMREAPGVINVVEACTLSGRQEWLDALLEQLELCEKALQNYLETKRVAFPRFYFVAPADLIDILSKGSDPQQILRHLPKIFDNVHSLEFRKDAQDVPTTTAIGMYSGEGEYVPFASDCSCAGPVEVWLQNVVDAMRGAVSAEFKAAMPAYAEKARTQWIFENSAQNTVVVSRAFFTAEVNEAFMELENGNEDALKDVYTKQVAQLSDLIQLINGDSSKNDRKKLITLCTIDVHARDVVQRLIDERVESASAFQWQSQLRYTQHPKTKECQVSICDAEIKYNYEYIGNCGCLCITPLTDRCYITLTQAQRLILGGAPAGPAGTGKTETTKDLARALGVQCYVFNCSDQMDYKAMGQIYKGLAQTGAWGCFDEFNRIPVAVLSVCSTQYKAVLDALRARKERFMFEGTEIALKPTVMAFITMNPGYPGRAELPESLKALFRPVSMCVPDLNLICEIMLMAEGFQQSKILSRKFVILYKLCEDLLSKSRHYDWKLRAIKTTLYVAGSMKRAAPELSEDKVLLRALRDFNMGKLTADDTSIFMGLLNDLFPKTAEHVPRALDTSFEAKVREAAEELGYQATEAFCLKVSQLREILSVRWSVFLLGPAGCGKTAIWRTLLRAQQLLGEKTVYKPINPKAVTRNELYGYVHPSTREWREGLISTTFRDMSNNKTNKHQWILLDGDIDAEWIESMNTVMDDNKMLTLASNERIPLTATMRLLLEINHMNHCSPATVSRGGVIYINSEDVGWRPAVDSWLKGLDSAEQRAILSSLFAKYVSPVMTHCSRNFKTVTPVIPINQAQTVCKILEGLLSQDGGKAVQTDQKIVEAYFVFACIWAFGGCLAVEKTADHRAQFSQYWVLAWKTVTFPDQGLVFDYFVDDKTGNMIAWATKVPAFVYVPRDFANLFVPTVETTRLTYLLNLLVSNKHHVMLVGSTGTGKTATVSEQLKGMDSDALSYTTVNLNSFTDAPSLQPILEQPLEKKSGTKYGPPGSKRLVYFVDDINMPLVDKYDTQTAIELMRQHIDQKGWFDKVKVVMKEVANTQYVACMNPTAGSFHITPRMQRHFVTLAVHMPSPDTIRSMYTAIIGGHLGQGNFEAEVARLGPALVNATLDLHAAVANTFLPSAVKFQYQFNLRELSAIAQGLCRITAAQFKDAVSCVRLWIHECERVFADRLISEADIMKFSELRLSTTKKHFGSLDQAAVEARPLLFGSFQETDAEGRPVYAELPGYEELRGVLNGKLAEYNEMNTSMDLVLFQQAMEHICRIARIISLPRGNAMLVGVGGSGKQSLARLASFICGYEVFQIAVTSTYGIVEFKENLLALYNKAGVKGLQVTFLITDNQIINEQFLVCINDFLSTGFITDLCTPEDKELFCNSVRTEVKATGLMDTPETCWDFFIDKVRRNLHVVLCFSPVGEKFQKRARQFPALVSCLTYDHFHTWPREALFGVAERSLISVPGVDAQLRESIAQHMAFVHLSVAEESKRFLETMRRYNYTTPKSYLEFGVLYKMLLAQKRSELKRNKERLENGVDKIAQASAQVADLQIALKEEQIVVEEKKAATQALIEGIGKEKAGADEAVEASRADEEAAAALQAEVTAFQDECSRELEAAEPIIAEAEAALNSLDKASLGELKSFGSPAAEVVNVVSACMVLTAPGGKIPKDLTWAAGKKSMGNVDAFLRSLLTFNKDAIPLPCVERCEKDYISNPAFNAANIRTKSGAAAGLCGWVINICKYFRIYQVVAPKRATLAEANRKLSDANKKLASIRARVKELYDRVANLENSLMKATEDKNAAMAQAERTSTKAKLADRLINGLSGEFQRWTTTIKELTGSEGMLVGNVLLASAFASYAGPFDMASRLRLVQDVWVPDLHQRAIPMSASILPLDVLTSSSIKARWAQEGLPADALSVDNGAIITAAARWPLMIDPQLQGIKWVISRETPHGLVILQQSQPKYIEKVIQCIENGLPLLIENLPEGIDIVLDNIIGKKTITRGRATYIKVGDIEVELNAQFRLYLATKIAKPHYRPEIAAQTTLVNFCVTEEGMEEQLLACVVDHERQDLQQAASALIAQLAEYTVALTGLEDSLLSRLSNSQGDILDDIALIENLEETKRTAIDIAEKVLQANDTGIKLSKAREVYRPVAARGALMYFIVDALSALDRIYHYTMGTFVSIMVKGMDITPGGKDESKVLASLRRGQEVDVGDRVLLLMSTITLTIFAFISQGLFERHKLVMASQLCMAVLQKAGKLQEVKYNYLVRGLRKDTISNAVKDWLSDTTWSAAAALATIDEYSGLLDDLSASAKRWQEWVEIERPEEDPLPGDWKRMTEFDRLLLFRALRPDRLTMAMRRFVAGVLGIEYTTSRPFDLEVACQDAKRGTPILVFLSPGLDVAAAVEGLGRKVGYTMDNGKYCVVSLGQGQESIAMSRIATARKEGGWVLLQNIHLTIDWTSGPLEKLIDKLVEDTHEDFRLFLSAEPPPLLERPLPISILQNSIKLTNEPPEGLKANLKRAYGQFSEDILEGCMKQSEYRIIIFALCYFHATIVERKKFGVGNLPRATSGIGWNMNYPFNTGDLLCSGQCTSNYLDNNIKVPWEDLRYMFGEIIYGGHIVEDWDRRLAFAYLAKCMNDGLLENLEICPSFIPPPSTYTKTQVLQYIESNMPAESATAYGLHPNAELGFQRREADNLGLALQSLRPQRAVEEKTMSTEEQAKLTLDIFLEKLPEVPRLDEIRARLDEPTPFAMVALQESERMASLLKAIRASLIEVNLGLKGDLTMSENMECIVLALATDAVPASWAQLAYPSLRPLSTWLPDLCQRALQLSEWVGSFSLPTSLWISGLFNPQSFLTAVMQTTARKYEWPLNRTVITMDVTRFSPDQINTPPKEGVYIHGMYLEGARWDEKLGMLDESRPKQVSYKMPVMMVRAVSTEKAHGESKDSYICPVYATEARFRQEVCEIALKTKVAPLKWTIAGVCMFMDVTDLS